MPVNNAGVAPSLREVILVASEGSFERLLRIKLKGFYFSTYDIVNWMIDQQRAGADDHIREGRGHGGLKVAQNYP